MPKEVYILIAAFVGALAAYITTKITSNIQLKIAQLNNDRDIRLQQKRLLDERLKSEVSIERSKLEKLHIILSSIALETSQTMSFIQSDSNMELKDFRDRYLQNCSKLHEARAIIDIYYPDMSDSVRGIYGQSNIFWGYQERILQDSMVQDKDDYQSNLGSVLKAGENIADDVRKLQNRIARRSTELKDLILME